MKVLLAILATLVALPGTAQTPTPHHWALLLRMGADLVDVDTALIRVIGGTRRVWLRWKTQATNDKVLVYSQELREVDCSRNLSRVLATEDRHEQGGGLSAKKTNPSDSVWYAATPNSLLSLAIRTMCPVKSA